MEDVRAIYTIAVLLYTFSSYSRTCEKLTAFESWEGLREPAMLPDGGGGLDARFLPFPTSPAASLPPLVPRRAQQFPGVVCDSQVTVLVWPAAVSSNAASRGQHPSP